MRGAYYVAFALLVAASTRTAAEPDQAEPHIAPNNDYMTSGGAFNKMLPRRILRESPDPKDRLPVYASDEERMVNRLSNGNSIAKGLERTIMKAANVLRTNGEDVIANAAKPIKNYNRLRPKLEIKKSKRQRIEPTLSKSSEHKLHTTSNSKKSLVSSASAKGQGRDEPRATVNTAKKMQHNHRSAPSRSSPTSADVSDGRLEKQLNAQKAINLDKNKRPDEAKIRNKKQHVIDPTPKNENGQALRAPPTPESLGIGGKQCTVRIGREK
uniref:Secreted RxLR effector protein 32 n=1 Tax=Plasmopara viticola TaxID=143451 RepID=RLR32_PLAVT|nr:RecName: Full=Secreted RxLR effector protein 32; Flags: Precursor [Plasmopara viticola]